MTKLLYVKASPKEDEDSHSAQLANLFLDAYQQSNPSHQIEVLDLYNEDIPFLDVDVFSAWGKFTIQEELTSSELSKVERMDELTDQFLNADKIIVAAPFWNLGYPPMLKAYIDTICIADKTFKYTENGPVGLVPDKPFLIIETRGGFYSKGSAANLEYSQSYLKTIMRFMGINDLTSVIAEGLDFNPKKQDDIIHHAKEELIELSKTF